MTMSRREKRRSSLFRPFTGMCNREDGKLCLWKMFSPASTSVSIFGCRRLEIRRILGAVCELLLARELQQVSMRGEIRGHRRQRLLIWLCALARNIWRLANWCVRTIGSFAITQLLTFRGTGKWRLHFFTTQSSCDQDGGECFTLAASSFYFKNLETLRKTR